MTEIFDNIKKLYQFSRPDGGLSDLVEFFSESSVEKTLELACGTSFQVRMFPSWTPTVWLNLGPSYQVTLGNKSHHISAQEDILVLRDSIVTRHNAFTDYIFTIKFFPGALEAIFGIGQSAFMGKVVPANSILPDQLIRNIKMQNCFSSRCQLAENFFLSKLSGQKKKAHYIQMLRDCIDLYEASDMNYNTSEVAEKMFITSRTINRYFHQAIGIGPKQYFSILRARKGLTAYLADRNSFNPGDHGYYDMSHFYRGVRQFTGQSLSFNS